AGQHVRDQVSQWLFGGDHDARNLGQLLPDFLQNFLAAATRIGVEANDDFRNIDSLSVLIQFSPARAATERYYTLNFANPFIDHAGDAVRSRQRRSRWEQHIDLHASFVERRQEVPAQLCDDEAANQDG